MYIWNESRASELLLVAMTYHSIVILGWQYCPPAIWLRALSRMALINESTPIPYSSSMILIKSPKLYNTGMLLHGRNHKFVRMRRIRAIPHVKVGRRVVSSPLRRTWCRSNLYTNKQFSPLPCVQVGERTEESLESTCIRSQSVPMGPIEGGKFDLLELKYWLYQPLSMNRTRLSAIDCFITFLYTYWMVTKNK